MSEVSETTVAEADAENQDDRWHWDWPRVIALVATAAFIGGVIGYLIGRPDSPSFNDVDIGFLVDMSTHHDGAIKLAFRYVPEEHDRAITQIAHEIITDQSVEINAMGVFLSEADTDKVNAVEGDNVAMEWMGHPVVGSRMPGMPSQADFEELAASSGVKADDVFTRLMIDHHAAGAAMADYESANGGDDKVRELAQRMAANQRVEIAELNERRVALGLTRYSPPADLTHLAGA